MTGGQALGRVWYRARQFGNVFRVGLAKAEHALIQQALNPAQQRLFYGMHPVAQRHHMDVCLDVQEYGWRDGDVLAAALLHDVGKGQLNAWERTAVVVAQNLAPGLFSSRFARRPAQGLFRWLAAQADHAERGSVLVAAAGGSSRTVALIRNHDRGSEDPAHDALRQADDRH